MEDDIWGQGYSIVRRGLQIKTPKLDLTREDKVEIGRPLFPEGDEAPWPILEEFTEGHMTEEELIEAAVKLKVEKPQDQMAYLRRWCGISLVLGRGDIR